MFCRPSSCELGKTRRKLDTVRNVVWEALLTNERACSIWTYSRDSSSSSELIFAVISNPWPRRNVMTSEYFCIRLIYHASTSKHRLTTTCDRATITMAFRCGQNIHIIKYEMENTNNLPKTVNESNCINTKSRILKSLSKY